MTHVLRRSRSLAWVVVVVVVAIGAAIALAGCDQCLLRPCGFCYDSLFQTLAPTAPATTATPKRPAPPIAESRPASMRH